MTFVVYCKQKIVIEFVNPVYISVKSNPREETDWKKTPLMDKRTMAIRGSVGVLAMASLLALLSPSDAISCYQCHSRHDGTCPATSAFDTERNAVVNCDDPREAQIPGEKGRRSDWLNVMCLQEVLWKLNDIIQTTLPNFKFFLRNTQWCLIRTHHNHPL